jgi:hypothetical protein
VPAALRCESLEKRYGPTVARAAIGYLAELFR